MYLRHVGSVTFPKAQNINVNMMPFIMGDIKSIPPEYRQYSRIINNCLRDANSEEYGKVGYLTISESLVKAGHSHRRAGIHTESPHKCYAWGNDWGGGINNGGIYMVSNVNNSCKAWDFEINEDMIGHLGSCENMTMPEDKEHIFEKDQLMWLTDRTPHESMILLKDTYRQFFRLVMSNVSIWYSRHSTSNRLGIKPPNEVMIIDESKF